jgi:2-dehydro-3-deoxygluconokinase
MAAGTVLAGGVAITNTEGSCSNCSNFDTGDLKIKTAAETKWDGLSAGEIMMRLDPTPYPTHRANTCRISYGGGEANVTVGLAACFGLRCACVTAFVDDGVGRNIENKMREQGMDTSKFVWYNNKGEGKFSTDGKGTLHNGINFTYAGKGILPAITEYYRAHTPIRELGPEDVDWEEIFGNEGVRWFHTGGIYTLISDNAAASATKALKIAGKHGTVRSFDLNYRSKVEPDKNRARRINKEIMHHVDMVVGNHDDFSDALGYETDKTAPDCTFDEWLATYTDMLEKVAADYPNVKYIGTQVRGALSADMINWSAILYEVSTKKIYKATVRENVEIMDRVGGGDSFMSGVAAGFLNGKGPQEAVEWGAAHGILVQETPGDTTMVTQKQIEAEVARAKRGGGVSALR